MACTTRLAVRFFALASGALSPLAHAEILQTFNAGFGDITSTVQIDFSNGDGYLFTAHHDGTLTGLGALQLFAAQVNGFTLVTDSFPWGELVTGLGVGGNYEYGTGDLWPIENYWHYWVTDGNGAWMWSSEGASDRVLYNGSADAWVFGTDVLPQQVPMPPVAWLLAACGARLGRGRRRVGFRRG